MKPQHLFPRVLLVGVVTISLAGCGAAEESGSTAAGVSSGATTAPQAQPATQPAAKKAQATRHATPGTGPASALGHQSKFGACHVRGVLPDPACTPGAISAGATVSQICTPGYSRSVRNVPESLKQGIYAEYGIASHAPASYEVDHLVSLELGGNNSAANLWPEISPGYHEKDGIENRLHDAVCSGAVSLHTAQVQIAREWRHTSVGAPTGSETYAAPSSPPVGASSPPSSTGTPSTSADFCTTHKCIASFAEGRGTIVQCADGEWSHSGGRPGVCSRHGGPR